MASSRTSQTDLAWKGRTSDLEMVVMRLSGLLARAVALVMVAVPLVAVAPATAVEPTVPTVLTWELSPVGVVPYHSSIFIQGQATYVDPEDSQEYAALGTYRLEKRYPDGITWTFVQDQGVDNPFLAYFDFEVIAERNTEYRVTFLGDDTYQPSSNTGIVKVSRKVSSHSSEPRQNVYYLAGRVRPAYAGRKVSLMRQKCSTCAWRVYTSQKTSATSNYRFRLPLPPRGATHNFKVRVPADTRFVKSFSTAWTLSVF